MSMNGLKKPVKTQTESTEISFISKIEKREKHPATGEVISAVLYGNLCRKILISNICTYFTKSSRTLNWENPKVREEIFKNINWWLDKGLGGFRIDAIINIKKKLPYKNYPSDREDGLCDLALRLADAQGVGDFIKRMHEKTFKLHDSFAVGEVFNAKKMNCLLLSGDGYFSSIFDFSTTSYGKSDKGWYDCRRITPDEYKECYFQSQEKIGDMGFYSNIIENHDEPRGVSYYLPEDGLCLEGKKMLAVFISLCVVCPLSIRDRKSVWKSGHSSSGTD